MSLGGVLFLTPKAGAIEEKASVFLSTFVILN